MKITFFSPKTISMRRQITIMFICLVTLPIMLINIVSGIIFMKSARNDLNTIYTANIREMGSNLEVIFKNALDLTLYPLMEQSLKNYLATPESDPHYILIKQNAGHMLNAIPYGYKIGIRGIGLHTETGNSIISDNHVKLTDEDVASLTAFDTKPYWDYSECASAGDSIYLIRRLRNPSALSQYTGYIKLAINSSELRSTMLRSLQNDQTSYFLMTPESKLATWVDAGHYLESKNTSFTYGRLFRQTRSGGDSFIWNDCIISSYHLDNGLLLYSITQPEVLSQVGKTFFRTMTIFVVLVFIFSLLLSMYFSKIITRPLKTLGEHMTSLSNEDFSTRADIKGCCEITVLASHFNDMANRLEYLYQKVYVGELKLKQSQLDMLQSQLNPHFLYNTLDTIYWMAKMSDTKHVSCMVSSLSRMMRMTISPKTNDKITLHQELEHLDCYLTIQRIRYGNKIDFQINCDPILKETCVLSFLLQPLVENAIVHGLQNSLSGIVSIQIYEQDSVLIYEVKNNGIPVNQADIQKILTSPNQTIKGFALRNISERIQLKYGNHYKLICYLDGDFSVFKITQPVGGDTYDENNTSR